MSGQVGQSERGRKCCPTCGRIVPVDKEKNISYQIANKNNPAIPSITRGRPPKYPWKTLKVGEYFIWKSKSNAATAHHGSYITAKRNGIKISIEKIADKTFRLWRVA